MNEAYNKLKLLIRNQLYHEETAYCLNYLTLEISDPEIAKELEFSKTSQYRRIIMPMTILMGLFLATNSLDLWMIKTGNPMKVILGGCIFFFLLCMNLVSKFETKFTYFFFKYSTVVYTILHVSCALCLYKDWTP